MACIFLHISIRDQIIFIAQRFVPLADLLIFSFLYVRSVHCSGIPSLFLGFHPILIYCLLLLWLCLLTTWADGQLDMDYKSFCYPKICFTNYLLRYKQMPVISLFEL